MIILASASPRRQELLTQIGCAFQVVVSEAEEEKGQDRLPEDLVVTNARLKALAVAEKYPEIPVLGADTVVSLDGKIYGKPKDAEDAQQLLKKLSGREHLVSTGIAFAWRGKVWQNVETTKVFFASLTNAEIHRYLETGEPMGKAGAYAIQGKAAAFIEKIQGSFSNVVGLPLHCVVKLAEKAGIDLYEHHGERLTSK